MDLPIVSAVPFVPLVGIDHVDTVVAEDFGETAYDRGRPGCVPMVPFQPICDSRADQIRGNMTDPQRAKHGLNVPILRSVPRIPSPRGLAVRALQDLAAIDKCEGVPRPTSALGAVDGEKGCLVGDERAEILRVPIQEEGGTLSDLSVQVSGPRVTRDIPSGPIDIVGLVHQAR